MDQEPRFRILVSLDHDTVLELLGGSADILQAADNPFAEKGFLLGDIVSLYEPKYVTSEEAIDLLLHGSYARCTRRT